MEKTKNSTTPDSSPVRGVLSLLEGVTLRFVTTTQELIKAFSEMSTASKVSADTETVARNEDGTLRDLDIEGPGAVRVLSMAARFDSEEGSRVVAYVFDLGHGVVVSPQTLERFSLSDNAVDIDYSVLSNLAANEVWYAWNADFDERVLGEIGVGPKMWQDLMLYQASLVLGCSGVTFYDSLASASYRHLGVDLDGKGTTQLSYTANDPLSVDQVIYAAADAVVTLLLVDVLETQVSLAGLEGAVALENRARPFRASMERSGIPFDTAGWRGFLSSTQDALDAADAKLAALTGGGQANFFDGAEKPNWKPGSPNDVKTALNTYAKDAVMSHLGRLYEKADSVDNAALKSLGHPLADALLEWRDHAKVLSTYGEKFIEFVRADGRVHARYIQNIVSTGRLACQKPNMQNNPPEMKPFYRPVDRPLAGPDTNMVFTKGQRVFVMGDLSQAELRYVAQLSGEPALIEAFKRGADMHSVTAGSMFHVDMDELKTTVEVQFITYRSRGKTMNFAVIYGLGPRALSQRLTLDGIPTTQEEAAEFLRLYLAAFPKMAEWLAERDAFIEGLISSPAAYDFHATIRLYRTWPKVKSATRALSESLGRRPTAREIVLFVTPQSEIEADLSKKLGRVPSPDELEVEIARRELSVSWMERFRAPVLVTKDLEPFSFESRTTVGRRRIFNVSAEKWVMSILMSVATARRGPMADLRSSFEKGAEVKLTSPNGRTLTRDQLKKVFEDKELKQKLLSHILSSTSINVEQVCYNAVADSIKSLGNAFRNAPIQGGVADAVLYSYGLLAQRLARFTNAVPVQSVHDSIVIEANVEEALEVAEVLRTSMEEGLSYFCPDVPAKADVDIATSLDAKHDKIEPAMLKAAF